MIDYTDFITDRTRDFTGREWVFAEIDRWLADPDAPNFFVITGEPGIGKTAIAARLTQIRDVAAMHFCLARQADTIDPLKFARFLSHQLTRLEGFAQGLLTDSAINLHAQQHIGQVHGQAINVKIENLIVNARSATEAFTHTVVEPLRVLYGNGFAQLVVILVDALDEAAEQPGPETIVDLLANVDKLPAPVRFLLTSRPEGAVLRHFEQRHIPHLQLNAGREENQQDIRRYVRHHLDQSAELRTRLAQRQMPDDAFIEQMTKASRGNFLYLVSLLPAIARKEQQFVDLTTLPQGLDGIYREFLRTRIIGRDMYRWQERYRPLLGVLAAAQESLTMNQLAVFTRLGQQAVRDALLDVRQFLDPLGFEQGQYRLYHQSLIDFLSEEERAAEFWIELAPVHRQIARYYQEHCAHDWSDCDLYGLRNLAKHLVGAERWEDLHQLIGQPGMEHNGWVDARYSKEENHLGYLSDLSLAMDVARNAGPIATHWQVRYSLIRASLKTVATNIPPNLLGAVLRYNLLSSRKALNYAEQSTDYKYQPWALGAVAPYTEDSTCRRLVKHLAPYVYQGYYENSFILKTLFQNLLDRGWIDDAISLIGTLGSVAIWSETLTEIAAGFSEKIKQLISTRFIELAGTKRYSYISGALARWAAILPKDERAEMLNKARVYLYNDANSPRESPPGDTLENDLLWFIRESIPWDPDTRMTQLLPFLDHLDFDSRKRVVKAAVEAANRNGQEHQCIGHLSRLLGYLDEPMRTDIEINTLDYWSRNLGTWSLGQVLPIYARNLSTRNRSDLLNLVLAYREGTRHALLLASLVPYQDHSVEHKIVETALSSLYKAPDWMKIEDGILAFDRLCPFLTREQISQALYAVLKINDTSDQLIACAAFVEEPETDLQSTVHGAFEPPFRSIESQMKYWKLLREFVRSEVNERGPQSSDWNWLDLHNSVNSERVEEYVARLKAEDAIEVRERIRKNKSSPHNSFSLYEEIRLLTIQAAKYQGQHRRALLKQAVKVAYKGGHSINTARSLEDILPLCDPETQTQLVEKILPDIAKHKWEDVIAVTTASLLPYSDPAKHVERIQVCLQRVFSKWPSSFRKVDYATDQIVLAMARFWGEFPDNELYETWLEILDDIDQLSRADLLITLAALAPLITHLGSTHTRQQVVDAITDVARWWP